MRSFSCLKHSDRLWNLWFWWFKK